MQLNKIKHRRGLDANLPAGGTEAGELRYSTDLKKLYIDDGIENVLLATNEVATGMSSVISDAIDEKVNKVSASDNCIVRFDGTLGDIQDSLATISDTGSLNVPVGQNFNINGVALKDVSETLTNKTINSPTITGTPTGITATHVGLGNVTNNAQVKKIASSTDNAIMRWDGVTGDLPQDSAVTISDTGTVNIPTGQNYNINGVNLKDVSETLTNKTLTAPVLNTEITGTGITTTGEANKLIKVNSSGRVVLGGADDGVNKLQLSGSISSTMSNATQSKNLTLTNSSLNGESSIIFRQDVTNDLAEISQFRNGYDGRLRLKASNASGVMNTCMEIRGSDKTVQLHSLAGAGNRMVVADASGNLSASVQMQQSVSNGTANNTAWVNIGNIAPMLGFTYMIGYYNIASPTLKGTAIFQSDGVTLTQISKADNTTIGVDFRLNAGLLQVITSTGGSSIAFSSNIIGV